MGDETELIKLKVFSHGLEDSSEIQFRVKQTKKMGKLMKSYAESVGLPVTSLRFLFDGRRINDDETPKALEMEQDDVIEVYPEMSGKSRTPRGSCPDELVSKCESSCSQEANNGPQISKCAVSLMTIKLDGNLEDIKTSPTGEEESRMLKTDLMVKRINYELEAKQTKLIKLCNDRTDLDEKISVEIELFDAEKEEMKIKNIRNREKLDILMCRREKAEDDYKLKGKQVENLESKISSVKTELSKMEETKLELVHEQDLGETLIKEVDSERLKLEQSIDKQDIDIIEEVEKKKVMIEKVNTRMFEVLADIENLSSVAQTPNKLLREFIKKQIVCKEKELECPICMDIAASPIFTCSEQHLICRNCRNKTEQCPVCSRSYHGELKRHRYAEQALEEVQGLKRELDG